MTFPSMSLGRFFKKVALYVQSAIVLPSNPYKAEVELIIICLSDFCFMLFLKVRIMKKRLVRKAFDMILGISMSENKAVCF